MTDPLAIPSDTARVFLQVTWQGLVHKCEKAILPQVATCHVVDKAIWDATVQVRRAVIQQGYPNADLTGSRVEFRNEFEAFVAIRSYLSQHPDSRFELVPPTSGVTDRWRAYFKTRPWTVDEGTNTWSNLDRRPAVGVGSVDYVAIENLLRFTEGREPIDG